MFDGNLNPMRSFARGIGVSEDVAIEVFEAEYQRLSVGARIRRYIGVIAEKRAKDRLKTASRTSPRGATGPA